MVAVAALVLMVVVAAPHPLRVVCASLFGASLVVLYTASTFYHVVTTPKAKTFFQVLDHASIYLLIAGSYTPLVLVAIGGAWGWTIFGIIWALALAGVAMKAWPLRHRGPARPLGSKLSTALYVVMGWLIVIAFHRLWEAVPPGGIWLLVAGGLCYTGGVAFFAWSRLPYNHAIWHVFVLAGSVCHVLATLFYILPG